MGSVQLLDLTLKLAFYIENPRVPQYRRRMMETVNLMGIPFEETNIFKRTINNVDQLKNIVIDIEVAKIQTPVI